MSDSELNAGESAPLPPTWLELAKGLAASYKLKPGEAIIVLETPDCRPVGRYCDILGKHAVFFCFMLHQQALGDLVYEEWMESSRFVLRLVRDRDGECATLINVDTV